MSVASMEAYNDLKDSGKSHKMQRLVFSYIKQNEHCTIPDIIRGLSTPHKTVSGRVSDLLDKGLIYVSGKDSVYSKYGISKQSEISRRKEIRRSIRLMRKVKSVYKDTDDPMVISHLNSIKNILDASDIQ